MNSLNMKRILYSCSPFNNNITAKSWITSCLDSRRTVEAAKKDQVFESRDLNCTKKQEIIRNTKFVYSELVPEFGLHMITPEMEIWHQPFNKLSEKCLNLFNSHHDPYWAIFWPGGQVLCRHIIDFPNLVKNKRVLDLGSGSGALAFASIIAGCERVLANDIDNTSIAAILLNAEENSFMTTDKLHVSHKNFLEGDLSKNARELANQTDVLLVGDMYFDEQIGDNISELALHYISYNSELGDPEQKSVLIGDPGRWYLRDRSKKPLSNLRCMAKYELPDEIKAHNFGLTQGYVFAATL